MLVAFDATTLAPRMSGVGYYTARLLEHLAKREGGEPERLVVLSNRGVPTSEGPRVVIHRGGRFPVRSVWMQLALPSILRRLRPDLAHFTNYLAPLACPVPYVVSVHDMSLSLWPRLHTLKKRLLTASLVPAVARRARLVLVPSCSTRADVLRLLRLDPGRIRVIPYAPAPHFRPTTGPPARLTARGVHPPYFLFVGTLEPRKNVARALRAFGRVAAELAGHSFVVAGPRGWGYRDALREATRPELQGRVTWLGYLPEEELPLLYSQATALVYPSLYEGFGFPVVEAMACGTPVLTSRGSSLEEIGEGAALLVDPRDEGALAESLRALAEDAPRREDLRRRGLARAGRFSWPQTAERTLEAYREAAG
jgi:glycosyltransferase involved in cell wall biosynthesis